MPKLSQRRPSGASATISHSINNEGACTAIHASSEEFKLVNAWLPSKNCAVTEVYQAFSLRLV
jgi:hypothetical protein